MSATVEKENDLHEVYASFSGDRLKAAASEAARAGNDDEAAFWLTALNVWAQARDKKAEWRKAAEREIGLIKDKLVEALSPVKVYLFGSFADGRAREDSDLDFYVVVKDVPQDIIKDLNLAAYRSIRSVRTRAVDIVVETETNFINGGQSLIGLESQVKEKGVLLYG